MSEVIWELFRFGECHIWVAPAVHCRRELSCRRDVKMALKRENLKRGINFGHFIDANWFVVTDMNCPCFSPWQQKSDEILFPWKGSIKKIWKFCHDLQLGGSRVLFMIFKKELFLNQCGIICRAIEEPRRSSKAFDKRVIIIFSRQKCCNQSWGSTTT